MSEQERVQKYGSPGRGDTWVISQYGRLKTTAGYRLAETMHCRHFKTPEVK